MVYLQSCAHYFHELGELAMDAAIADRRYLAPVVASPNPLFHFLSKKFLDSATRTWHASLTGLPQLKEKRKVRSGLRD